MDLKLWYLDKFKRGQFDKTEGCREKIDTVSVLLYRTLYSLVVGVFISIFFSDNKFSENPYRVEILMVIILLFVWSYTDTENTKMEREYDQGKRDLSEFKAVSFVIFAFALPLFEIVLFNVLFNA